MTFFFELYADHRDLHVLTHSFPTRRSSDLMGVRVIRVDARDRYFDKLKGVADPEAKRKIIGNLFVEILRLASGRSEEHTSELQPLMRISYAVFSLKKKQTHTQPEDRKILTKQTRHTVNHQQHISTIV